MHQSPSGFSFVARISRAADRIRVLPLALLALALGLVALAMPLTRSGDPSAATLAEPGPQGVHELMPAPEDDRWSQDGAPSATSRSGRAAAPSSAAAEASTSAPKPRATQAEETPSEAAAAETSTAADTTPASGAARPSPAPAPEPAPDPSPPAPAKPAASGAGSSLESQVLTLVNKERAAAGCAALKADSRLASVARAHSADMRDRGYFDHNTPEGRSPFDRAEKAGLSHARAENIAYGQPTPAAVMAAWMGSPGHRANILDCGLRTLGVGVATGSGGPWWTQLFGV